MIIYVKNTLSAYICQTVNNTEFEESLWCTVEICGQRFLIGICYLSLSSKTYNNERLLNMLEKAVMHTKTHNLIIMGDFNYPHIDFTNGMVTAAVDNDSSLFFNKTQEFYVGVLYRTTNHWHI